MTSYFFHLKNRYLTQKGLTFFFFLLIAPTCFAQLFGFSIWNQQLSLAFTTAPQAIFNKNCSGTVTIQTRRSGVAYSVAADTTINLSGPANMTLYSDATCVTVVSSVTVTTGTSSVNIFFIDTANATPKITATATNYLFAEQTQGLTANGFVWTGSVSSAWSTGGNWSGGFAPGASDLAVFDGSCVTNCSPSITGPVTIRGLRMSVGYAGTITQPAIDFTFGTGGFVQVAGTFVGSSNPANFLYVNNGLAAVGGGTFTAPAGTMRVSNGWQVAGSPTMAFPSNSTFSFFCSSGYSCSSATVQIFPGSATYQNVTFSGRQTNYELNAATMIVSRDFLFGDTFSSSRNINNGNIRVAGHVTQADLGYTGTAWLILTGNASGQTITGNNTYSPRIELLAGSNSVTLTGQLLTYGWVVTTVGSFTSAGSTLNLYCASGFSCSGGTMTVVPGLVTYNHVIFDGHSSNVDLSGGTMEINGNFTLGDRNAANRVILNGTLNVYGNINLKDLGYTSDTAALVARGNVSGQTITGVSGRYFPPLRVDAGAHPVILSGTVQTSQWTMSSVGTFTVTGSDLNIQCGSGLVCDGDTIPIAMGSVAYNNVSVRGFQNYYEFGGSTVIVNGNFVFGDVATTAQGNIWNATFHVYGNISNAGDGYYMSSGSPSTIVVKGNPAGQTLTGIGGKGFLDTTIEAGTNPVTLAGTLEMRSFTYVSSGTYTTTGSTLRLSCSSSASFCANTLVNVALGNLTYNNLQFNGHQTSYNFGGSTVTVGGNFIFGDGTTGNNRLNNGTFNISGNITAGGNGDYGSAILVATGRPSGQTITGVPSRGFPHLRIDAGTHPITLVGEIWTPDYYYISSGTFTSTGSKVRLMCDATVTTWSNCSSNTKTPTFGSVVYDEILFVGSTTTWDLGGNTIEVNKLLTLADGTPSSGNLNNGTINVYGDLLLSQHGYRGDALVVLKGNPSGQTVTGISFGRMPKLKIEAGSNPVTFVTGVTVQSYEYISSGAFTATGSTLTITCSSGQFCDNTTVNLKTGSVTYNNVALRGFRTAWNLGGDTFKVSGSLTLGDGSSAVTGRIENGTLEASGNVTMVTPGSGGNAALRFVGTTPQTVTGNFVWPSGPVTVDTGIDIATGLNAVVSQGSAINWNTAGKDMTVVNGTYNMAGFALTVNDVLTIGTGATLTRSGGSLTYGSLVNNGTLNP